MSDSSSILHPVAISQVIVNFAARHGVDQETCLLGTDISAEQLCDADALISRAQEMRLLENLMLALPDFPALGFELGLEYKVSTFGIWGFALRTSRNLREAAQRAIRYLPLSTAYCRIGIVENGESFGVSADASSIPAHLRQLLLERDMATGINLMRELGLAGISIQSLQFRGPKLAYSAKIDALSCNQAQYQQAHNAVTVRSEDADRPLPMYDQRLVAWLEDQCRTQLDRRQIAGISGQVREKLLGPLGLVASLDEVARSLTLSPRSLRRKLDSEGSSFRQIVENERQHLAEQLLQSSQMKLDELALHLGYADTASFTRAFRRWFGQSPGQYRNQFHSQN